MAIAYLDWHEYPPSEVAGGAVTIGNFDGVHRGHQALVAAACRQAKAIRGPAVVMTFTPPPHQVLHPGSERPPLTTIPHRARLLHSLGADHLVVLRAGPALLALSPEAFFEDIVVRQLGAKALVEGYNFRFGRGRSGTTQNLRSLSAAAGLAFEEIPQVVFNGEPVSSSRVRAALVSGDVERAAELLARNYSITGTVITGAKRGRTIGFPTANLGEVQTVLPDNGVYAVRAHFDGGEWPAAANIGPNPTFGEDARKVEVHVIGYSDDLYGKQIEVEFVARLRETKPFESVEQLITQLQFDIEQAKLRLT